MPVDENTVRQKWADAYAAQSYSDFEVYESLGTEIAECHRLHYLQMACEKIAKAYRIRDMRASVAGASSSHIAFSKFIEAFMMSAHYKLRYTGKDEQLRSLVKQARGFASEIEKLAPAVDRESSPANAEYPWLEGEEVVIPCRYRYPLIRDLNNAGAGGGAFLKTIKTAIQDFSSIRLV